MRQLSRYVSFFVMSAILMVLLIIVSLDVISAIIDGAGDTRNDYTFVEVLKYVLTTLPSRIYENIPFSALIGCLLGLGLLAGNSELVIMRAAGISLLRIVTMVLRPVLLVIALGVVLGEYAVPYTDQLAESRRMLLRGGEDAMASASGMWNREGNEYMNFSAVFPDGKLFGVTRYQFDENNQLQQVSFAVETQFVEDHWSQEKVVETRFVDGRTETETFAQRRWDTNLSPDLLGLVVMPAQSLSMQDLYSYAVYLRQQGQDDGNYWLAFWGKALQPVSIISLVMIAVSFIFGPLREVTMGHRVFAGVITGIVFRTSQELLGPASLVYGFDPFWAVMAPAIACMLVGLLLLRRAA